MNNSLTVSVAGTAPTSLYTFTDAGETITLGAGAIAAGWTGSGTNTVKGASSTVSSIGIDLGDGNDLANIQSINAPTSLTGGSGTNTVNVCSNAPTGTGNLNGINADLTVTASNGGTDTLNVSNFGAAAGDSNVVVGPSTITGFAGPTDNHTINYVTATGGSFTLVHLIGSNSPTLAEKFTVNDPNASTFQLDSNAGGDTAIVEGTNSGSTNNINMGAGAATVTVSSDGTGAGSLANILGALNINEGTGSKKTLNLIDYGGSGGKSVTVSGTSVTGFTPAPISYKAVGGTFGNITLSGSNTASDAFTVTANSPAVNLEANGGGDTFILKNNATVKSIAGGSGADTLTYGFGYTNAVSVTLAGSNANGFSSASATGISGGFTGIDVLNGAGSSTLGGESAASTWTVNAVASDSTYSDGSNNLTFSGFSTLDGGTGGNTFNLAAGASGYAVNGSTGSDTLTGVSNAVLSSSNSSGFSGTAASSIAFSAIDTLNGSGSLTGENTTNTWTLGSPSTYFDGSNALDFSGFTTLNGSGTDTLANVASATLNGSPNGFSGAATAPAVAFTGMDVLQGTGSGFLIGENAASTWTINASGSNSIYSDGPHSLTFTGFTNLTGGTAGNTFNVQPGATGYAVNGSTGSDTLTGVSNAVLTFSDATGFSGTAANTISFTGIDALTGSGTLTGESAASTWTVNAVASSSTYNDGTDNLTFSGFSTLDGGTGGNTFNLGAAATGYTINGNTGTDTLTGVSNAVLSSSSSSGFSGTAANTISFTGIDALTGSGTLTGESAASTWTVNAVASTSTYNDGTDNLTFSGFSTLDGGTGGNTFNLGAAASGYTLNGNSGSDTLTGVSNAVLTSSDASGFTGTAASSIAFSAIDVLDGAGSLTGENVDSTWTVNAVASDSIYNDGSNNLTVSGFSTLDGGTGGNTFNLGAGASGYAVNGNSGSDTLTGVSNAVLSGSTASGFSGTAAGSIAFNAIDTLDGSGSLTGENVDSTWNLNAAPTYTDAANTLSFSSFDTIQGGSGNDTFNVVPQQTQPWTIDGGPPVLPTLPGDVLNLNLTGTTGVQQTVTGSGDGTFTFTNRSTVTYTSVETINATGGQFALVLDMAAQGLQDGNATPDVVNASTDTNASQDLVVTVANNGGTPAVFFNGAASGVSSFTVIGSADPQTVNVDETNGALPPITITGGATTTGVNTLNVTLTNATGATDTLTGPNAGTFTFGNRAGLNYSKTEVVNGAGGTFALVINTATLGFQDGNATPDVVSLSTDGAANLLATAANDGGAAGTYYFGAASGVGAITVTGSADPDTLNVDETNGNLPVITFNAGAPNPPASPGDTLDINLTNATTPALTRTFSRATGYSGSWTFGNRQAVNYNGVESLLPAEVSTAVLKTTGELDLYNTLTGQLQLLSAAGSILAASTVQDASGATDVFVITSGANGLQYLNTLWEYSTATGMFTQLSTGSFHQISAATNSAGQPVLFGVLTDNSLWEQDPALGVGLNAGFTNLSAAGTILSVSAVTDAAGNPDAFAITESGPNNVWEHNPALPNDHWEQLSSGNFLSVSAGLNGLGQAVVYGVVNGGSLWEQNPAVGTGLDAGWTRCRARAGRRPRSSARQPAAPTRCTRSPRRTTRSGCTASPVGNSCRTGRLRRSARRRPPPRISCLPR